MHKLSNSSKQKLNQAHILLQLLCNKAIKVSPVDFGITYTHRSVQEQNKLFREGKSKLDGINKMSKHNYLPSLAFDVVIYVNGKVTWQKEYYIMLAGVMFTCAAELGIKIRWGGNFDMDDEILEQDFDDLCHFELMLDN